MNRRTIMNEPFTLLLAAMDGGLLGMIFFGGLWWTVRRGLTSNQPAFLFLGSMLVRTGIVLDGFYFVANQHLARLVVCLIGFIIARLVVTRVIRNAREPRTAREAAHAP
jgi:F1F0 ATPase subunit 2